MEITKSSFEQYKKNYTEWAEQEQLLLQNLPKEEWMEQFRSVMLRLNEMVQYNKEFKESVSLMLDKGLTQEQADFLYDAGIDLYFNDYEEIGFLYYLFINLYDYYESQNDIEKMIMANTVAHNYYKQLYSPEALGRDFDTTLIKRGMGYSKYFLQASEMARLRIFIMYYSYIDQYLDYGVINLEEAMEAFDEFLHFCKNEEVASIIEKDEKLKNLKTFTIDSFVMGIICIFDTTPKVQKKYYSYVTKYFQDNYSEIQSYYELTAEEYGCYLYKEYVDGKIDQYKGFDLYLEYFVFKFNTIKTQASLNLDDLIRCINAIRIITNLGMALKDANRLNRAYSVITDFVQTRWVRGKKEDVDKINEMLSKACLCLLSFEIGGLDREKCIKQLIIQRNITNYLHSSLTAEISIAIYREINKVHTNYFKGVKSIPVTEWRNYLYYAAMFHDIGANYPIGLDFTKNRPLYPFEEEAFQLHTLYGKNAFLGMKGMEKYIPVIYGHHFGEDGISGYPKDFSKDAYDVYPFVQIVGLASEIEKRTNFYWDFEKKAISFSELLASLDDEKGTLFSEELVNLLQKSNSLQKEIQLLITTEREHKLFELYRDWEKIQFEQDEESILDEIEKQIDQFRISRNETVIKPYIDRLLFICTETRNDFNKGRAFYLKMRYLIITGNYFEAFLLENDTCFYLEKSKNYYCLVKNYSALGISELIRENRDSALNKFLHAVEIAKFCPECEIEKNSALTNIASIYASVSNHEKAIEYYEQAASGEVDEYDAARIACMAGYSYMKVGKKSKVRKCKNQLLKNIHKPTDESKFPVYVYLVCFYQFLGETDKMEEFLGLIDELVIPENELEYYLEEVKLYVDILESLGRYAKMLEELDKNIEYCVKKQHLSDTYVTLMRKRVHCLACLRGEEEYLKIEKQIVDSESASAKRAGVRMEELEKNFLYSIKLEREKAEYSRHQEYLEETVEKAKSASEQKSQFLSSMSHEIRTPINAILGLNEMILRESNEEDILQYATDIHNAGKQLLGIVNDVLDYSKIEAGKMEITPQKYVLGEMINDIKNMMEPKFTEKNLRFLIRCDNNIPNVLYGDDLRIKQVLLNLLSNAYKYTPKGHVLFKIDYQVHDEKSIDIHFEVKDTGLGLKKEQIEKLSVPFERFELSQNRNVEGTGLGMSIVTKLLEQMDSKLLIESVFGEGSTFGFVIKQDVIEWKQVGHFEEIRKKILDNAISNTKGQKYVLEAPKAKVLVVDDNAVNLKVIKALLKRTKIQVTTASSGAECLELCESNGYHVIFLDHMMPEMDGIETLQKLIEMGGINEHTPKIALTANVMDSGEEFYKKAGFHALLTKPINVDELEKKLREFLPDYLQEG